MTHASGPIRDRGPQITKAQLGIVTRPDIVTRADIVMRADIVTRAFYRPAGTRQNGQAGWLSPLG